MTNVLTKSRDFWPIEGKTVTWYCQLLDPLTLRPYRNACYMSGRSRNKITLRRRTSETGDKWSDAESVWLPAHAYNDASTRSYKCTKRIHVYGKLDYIFIPT